jgi:hypothetical protein
MTQKYSNSLAGETSPYLLQHAHNPVNWYAWGKIALEKAKQEDKIILISIGYSACHWCHVMERESFEDEATAALMNKHFINIKIDREERPDIDQVYMDAVQAITGSGGWPLNVFLTPETKPFFGGTYFPPVKAFNRPSWKDVLRGVAEAWKERRAEIESQAENLTGYIGRAGDFTLPAGTAGNIALKTEFSFDTCETIFSAIMSSADKVWGGFGRAPKFPQTFNIQFLLQYFHYSSDADALQQALLSIDKMLDGGIYDQVGGGLSRYSTDEEWLAPHFEKMLYDNALFLLILCDAYQLTRLEKYRIAICHTIDFVKKEMLHPEGGFYAALDADSEGEEGRFYVWEKNEIDRILGPDAAIFCDYFDVTENGNWESKNILRKLTPLDAFVQQRQVDKKDFLRNMDRCLQLLKTERNKRVRPGLDDKIILGWNALMLKAIAKSAVVLRNEEWKQLAVNNVDFLVAQFSVPGTDAQLMHTWKNGIARYPAFLDDYANLADACIMMYELSFENSYLEKAKQLCEYVVDHFSDSENLLFHYTHKDQDDILVRKKELYDGAVPSGNAVMAFNLFRLSVIFDMDQWRQRSDSMVQAVATAVVKYPGSFALWASLLMQKVKGPDEIAIVGEQAMDFAAEISAEKYLPAKIILASPKGNNSYPMLAGKEEAKKTGIYMCKNYMCDLPVYDIHEFLRISHGNKI